VLCIRTDFIRLTNNLNAALLLSQALYWSQRTYYPGGWFWKSQKEWTQETSLTRGETERARKLLREKGFLEEKQEVPGGPLFFRINEQKLWEALTNLAQDERTTLKTSMPRSQRAYPVQNERTLLETNNPYTEQVCSEQPTPAQDEQAHDEHTMLKTSMVPYPEQATPAHDEHTHDEHTMLKTSRGYAHDEQGGMLKTSNNIDYYREYSETTSYPLLKVPPKEGGTCDEEEKKEEPGPEGGLEGIAGTRDVREGSGVSGDVVIPDAESVLLDVFGTSEEEKAKPSLPNSLQPLGRDQKNIRDWQKEGKKEGKASSDAGVPEPVEDKAISSAAAPPVPAAPPASPSVAPRAASYAERLWKEWQSRSLPSERRAFGLTHTLKESETILMLNKLEEEGIPYEVLEAALQRALASYDIAKTEMKMPITHFNYFHRWFINAADKYRGDLLLNNNGQEKNGSNRSELSKLVEEALTFSSNNYNPTIDAVVDKLRKLDFLPEDEAMLRKAAYICSTRWWTEWSFEDTLTLLRERLYKAKSSAPKPTSDTERPSWKSSLPVDDSDWRAEWIRKRNEEFAKREQQARQQLEKEGRTSIPEQSWLAKYLKYAQNRP
jgi:hypothetical protein